MKLQDTLQANLATAATSLSALSVQAQLWDPILRSIVALLGIFTGVLASIYWTNKVLVPLFRKWFKK